MKNDKKSVENIKNVSVSLQPSVIYRNNESLNFHSLHSSSQISKITQLSGRSWSVCKALCY